MIAEFDGDFWNGCPTDLSTLAELGRSALVLERTRLLRRLRGVFTHSPIFGKYQIHHSAETHR
ncbi:hypothetical protein SH668x_002024 [Planctomicrobium sp. SH668]|uniref:hypothetical protein n=1 Tax=Planctomicrobium sp. SH668 TaxID=3448126 RepID=UPI003F5C8714